MGRCDRVRYEGLFVASWVPFTAYNYDRNVGVATGVGELPNKQATTSPPNQE